MGKAKTMPTSALSVSLRHLLADLGPDGDGRTDGELLGRFVRSRDEDALAALVRRHASMVWGVCRRLLRNQHDAEDAFQATFLVLVRKASAVPREAVANWLYGVARQTAVRGRATAAKRGRRETQVVDMPEPTVPEVRDAELPGVVDEELSRLPGHYRGVVVLCDLEGATRKDAARQLGIPEGSVASRLARARALLAKRLRQRGVVFSGSVAAALSAGSASSAPPALVASTIRVASLLAAGQATGLASAKVAALTEGVVKAMFVSKLKAALSVALVLGVLATGAAFLASAPAAGQDDKKPGAEKPVDPAAKQQKEKEKEAFTAWGEESGGLQAGLGYLSGERRPYGYGETVTLVVRVRNVGTKAIKFEYLKEFFTENPPVVTGADGKKLPAERIEVLRLEQVPVKVTLAPGKEIELSSEQYRLRPKERNKGDADQFLPLRVGRGKAGVQYERLFGNTSAGRIKVDPDLFDLRTGSLELEIIPPAPPPPAPKGTPTDRDRLQGNWQIVSLDLGGMVIKREDGLGQWKDTFEKEMFFKGDRHGQVGHSDSKFKLDEARDPKQITVYSDDGKLTYRGIYAIEGDTLKLCMNGDGTSILRPEEFMTKTGSQVVITTLKRVTTKK